MFREISSRLSIGLNRSLETKDLPRAKLNVSDYINTRLLHSIRLQEEQRTKLAFPVCNTVSAIAWTTSAFAFGLKLS